MARTWGPNDPPRRRYGPRSDMAHVMEALALPPSEATAALKERYPWRDGISMFVWHAQQPLRDGNTADTELLAKKWIHTTRQIQPPLPTDKRLRWWRRIWWWLQ
jgi:hypothetical protein